MMCPGSYSAKETGIDKDVSSGGAVMKDIYMVMLGGAWFLQKWCTEYRKSER